MIGPLAISAAVAALLAPFALRTFIAAGRTRENYRGRRVVFPSGVIALACGVLALGLMAALDTVAGTGLLVEEQLVLFGALDRVGAYDSSGSLAFDAGSGLPSGLVAAAATLALGVGLLGLADDALEGSGRGLRGHARALARGKLTTGALKALGIPALTVFVLAGGEHWLLSAALVALTANLFNLLDLRPGRAVKAFVLLGAGLVIAGEAEWLRPLGAWVGPLLVLGLYDLRERAMLGDTGANVLGALAGLWLVLALGTAGEAVALAVVVALTLYGEVRSISATVDALPPLRWLDRLGRPAEDAG